MTSHALPLNLRGLLFFLLLCLLDNMMASYAFHLHSSMQTTQTVYSQTLQRRHLKILNQVSSRDRAFNSWMMSGRSSTKKCSSRPLLQMRDHSSATVFKVGEKVRVVDDVMKGGSNLRGSYGVVTETWEKCDVDPTCCCAEQVDVGMDVTVRFDGNVNGGIRVKEGESFVHFFSEDELDKVKEENVTPVVAFDGLSCKAFKLEQMKNQNERLSKMASSRLVDEKLSEGGGEA